MEKSNVEFAVEIQDDTLGYLPQIFTSQRWFKLLFWMRLSSLLTQRLVDVKQLL